MTYVLKTAEFTLFQDTGNNNEGSGDGATKYGVKEQIALLSQVNQYIQGDCSGCVKPPVDTKTKVAF